MFNLLLFYYVLKQVPSNSVVNENDTTLFCCEAPE